MKSWFSLKTRLWPPSIKSRRKPRRGALTLLSVFLFFVFATLGMSMLFLTQVYLKLSSFKKNSAVLNYASENGIKQGFDQIYHHLSKKSSPSLLTEDQYSELRENVQNQGKELIEELLGCALPLHAENAWENMSWESQADFMQERYIDKEAYTKVQYTGSISSRGKLTDFRRTRNSVLRSELEALIGNIPLPSIPFLLDKTIPAEQKENFSERNRVAFLTSEKNLLPVRPAFSEGGILPQHALSQLSKALKIDVFHPQDLTSARLRQVLGLDIRDEPVPDGVYLINDDLGLGGVFVQGDLEEMVLAVEGDYQVVSFLMEQGLWILKFSPSLGKSIFSTPTDTFLYELVPLGIIIINGRISSLCSGVIELSGEIVKTRDEDIPAVLQGVNLTIVCSDEITLTSHLVLQGMKWEQGIPYIKDSNTQLHIFAAGSDFVELTERAGQIIIGSDSPEEVKIQASLTASNRGFSIEGDKKSVHLLGSLQTSEYLPNDSELKIKFDERFYDEDAALQDAAKTEKPILYLSYFRVTEWNEN